jgi:hypothetical protein
VGDTIPVRVIVSSPNQSINAVSASLTATGVDVESITKGGSVLNFWPAEPSTGAGTATFEGVSLTGYQGSSGVVITVILRASRAGAASIVFKKGQVLANDGKGTDVTESLSSASFTIVDKPAPAPIVPASNEDGPVITSSTHPDPARAYPNSTVELAWSQLPGATASRIGYDRHAAGVPTVVYDPAIFRKTIELGSGVWYFHAQEKTAAGWSKVTTFKISIGKDSSVPATVVTTPVVATTTQATSTEEATSTPVGLSLTAQETPSDHSRFWTTAPWILSFLLSLLSAFTLLRIRRLTQRTHRALRGSKVNHAHAITHTEFTELKSAITSEILALEHARTRRALSEEEDRFIDRMKVMLERAEQNIEKEMDSLM